MHAIDTGYIIFNRVLGIVTVMAGLCFLPAQNSGKKKNIAPCKIRQILRLIRDGFLSLLECTVLS